uniref:Zgc:174164 n=1 Tax=Cyprinus carpio TaxID=7962 RepID=A0A8C1QUJ2_CYPCA
MKTNKQNINLDIVLKKRAVIMLVVLFQELCHYQGHVEGYEDSLVALSCNHCTLCFKGIILIGNNSYGLERSLHSKTNEHLLYLLKDSQSEPFICGLANETSSSEDHSHYDDMSMFIRVGKYTKYVELVLVVDHQRVSISHEKSYYKQLNIRIALIGLKIFDKENPFNVNGNPGKVLGRFVQWRKTELLSQLRHDVGQLIVTNYTFMVLLCTIHPRSLKVIQIFFGATKFSDCSKKDFERLIQRGGRACLRNPPSQDNIISAPRCGNGILESGEECDCDLVCILASCCNNNTCKTTGKFDEEKSVSRRTSCSDVRTVCGGTSPFCPADFYVMEGLPLFCMFEFMLFFFLCISGYSEAMKTDDKCFSHVNTLGNSFGNCGYSGSNPKPCEVHVVKIEGNTIICMNADFNMGLDVPDPAYVETGSVCAPGKVRMEKTRHLFCRLIVSPCVY